MLAVGQQRQAEITKTPNGENPLVHGGMPVLGCDVWEHSYYIDYRNARPKYLEAWVDNLINWDYVLELYEKAARLARRAEAGSAERASAPFSFRSVTDALAAGLEGLR